MLGCYYLGAEHKFTLYGALFLMTPGAYATAPVLAAWMANNSEPYYRRATSVAIGFIATNSVLCLSFPLRQVYDLFIHFFFRSYPGRYFEYVELPNQ
jgi:hypothetical protein